MDANQLVVIDVRGSAGVIQDDGSIKAINVGDVITVGDTVITADNSTILIDVQGESLSIPANKKVTITPDLFATEVKDSSENTVFDDTIDEAIASLNQPTQPAPQQQPSAEISDFLDALEGGGDILDNLEATAAGGTGGAVSGGGTSFVELARIAESIDPTSLTFDDSLNTNDSGIFSPRDTSDGIVPEDTLVATLSVDELGGINNPQPVITGSSENLVGQTVTVTVTDVNGNTQQVTAVVQPDGTFTTVPLDPLPDGPINIDVVVLDPNGNPITDNIGANIDTVPPQVIIASLPDSSSQTVVINGTASGIDVGDNITITVIDSAGQTQTFVTQIDEQGNWSITANEIAEGLYSVQASALDAVGNEGTDNANGLVDLTAPVISINTIGETNDTTPTISGMVSGVAVGSEITVVITAADNTVQTVVAIVAEGGSWVVDVPDALIEGEFSVTATAVDSAGNESQASTSGIIDLTAPEITLTAIANTNDTTPIFTGRVDGVPAGTEVTIQVIGSNGQSQILTTITQADGSYSVEASSAISEGSFTATATVSDTAGNSASANTTGAVTFSPITITIDSIADSNDTTPLLSGQTVGVAPGTTISITITASDGRVFTLLAITQEDGSWSIQMTQPLPEGDFTVVASVLDPQGNEAQATTIGNVDLTVSINFIIDTNDTTPSVSGSTQDVPAGAVVTVTFIGNDGATETLQVVTDANGNWSVEATIPLVEGQFSVTATVTDNVGNTATATEVGEIDLTDPTISINALNDTNDTTPTISGSVLDVPEGTTVSLIVTDSNGLTQTLTTTTDALGNWQVDVQNELSEGDYTVTASASDEAGNTSTATVTGTIDLTAPIITINAIGDINDNTPTLSGTTQGLEAGSTVTITVTDSVGSEQQFITVTNADGSWSITVSTPLPEGRFSVLAQTQDEAGNEAEATEVGTLDLTPALIEIDEFADSNDVTPVISGIVNGVEAGAVVTVLLVDSSGNQQVLTAVLNEDGSWQVGVSQALAEGAFSINASVSDAAGNEAQDTEIGVIDLTAPIVILDVIGGTADDTPTISGTVEGVEAGTTVNLVVTDANGVSQSFIAVTNSIGVFSTVVPESLAQGEFTVTATATDNAGNQGLDNEVGTVDNSLLTIEIDEIGETNDTTPTMSGSTLNASLGDVITVEVISATGVVQSLTTTVDTDGNWSVTVPAELVEGEFTVNATVTNQLGNLANDSATGLVDVTAPIVVIDSIGATNDSTPLITGTSEGTIQGSIVTVTVVDSQNNSVEYTTTVDANGNWLLPVNTEVSQGQFTVTASITDTAGNTGTDTEVGTLNSANLTLTLDFDPLTNETTPLLSGTTSVSAGSIVTVLVVDSSGVTQTLSAVVAGDGTWSTRPNIPLAEGSFNVTASVVDQANNQAQVSQAGVVDSSAPVISIDNIGTVNDTSPTITGQTDEPAGSVVTVVVSDGVNRFEFSAAVNSDGSWSGDVPGELQDGNITVTASIVDAAGNPAQANSNFILNSSAASLAIDPIADTNDSTPTITGTSDAPDGSVVSIIIEDSNNNTQQLTTVVQNGVWSVVSQQVLSEGAFNVSASVTVDGLTSDATAQGLLDITPPTVNIDAITDTNDVTPTISGQTSGLVSGSEVILTIIDSSGVAQTISAIVFADGSWSVDVENNLAEGQFSVQAEVVDNAGNEAADTETGFVDLTAPTITIDDINEVNDATPTLSGQTSGVPAGSLVTLQVTDSNGNTQILQATISAEGSWSVETDAILAEGTFSVIATVEDTAGNQATDTASGIIDTTAPSVDIDPQTITNDTTPIISGQTSGVPSGTEVRLTITDNVGNVQTILATTNTDGSWSVVVSQALAEGSYTVSAEVSDAAGNIGTDSEIGEIDVTAPSVTINVLADSNDVTPTLSGQTSGVPVGGTVTLVITDSSGNIQTLSATVQPGGSWSIEPSIALAEGTYTVVATVIDAAGNSDTDTQVGTIDITAPAITIDAPALTNDNTPTVTGSSDLANTSLNITFTDANGIRHTVTVVTDSSGNWSVEASQALADGNYIVTATITDIAGNASSATDSGVVDTIPPELAFEATFLLGQLVTLNGTSDLPAGSTVTITQNLLNGELLTYTATTQADGSWTLTGLTVPLGNLASITATASDEAGNVRTISSADFDDTPPVLTVSVDSLTSDNTPVISGTSDAGEGAQVTVVVTGANNATQTLTAIVDASGNWGVSPTSALVDGQFTVEASVRDGVGNLTQQTVSGVIDTTAPELTITTIGSNNDVTPVLSGTGDEIGAVITLTVTDNNGVVQTFTAIIANDGTWSKEVPSGLAEGSFTVVATVSDAIGNTTTQTANGNIDLTPPVVTVNDNGLVNVDTPVLSGTSTEPAGTLVSITVQDSNGDNYSYSAVVAADGSWQTTASALPDGSYTITATITDAAGNVGSDIGTGIIDTTPPQITINNLGTVNTDTPTISGTASEPAGTVISIVLTDSNGIETMLTATVDGSGNWSVTSPSLSNDDYSIVATIEDAAGNSASVNESMTLNTAAPSITIDAIGETNDTTPTITGTTDAPNGSLVTVTFDDGVNPIETVTAFASGGVWSVTATNSIAQGSFTVNASVTVGSIEGSAIRTGTIDLTSPTIEINEITETNDTTPTISGTTDAAVGSIVTLAITDSLGASQTITTTVMFNGSWSVATPTELSEGTFNVSASVTDTAGNTGVDSTTGVIDLIAPTVEINSLVDSNDVTPLISGQSSGLAAGNLVTLVITDSTGNVQNVTAVIQSDGSWSAEPTTVLAEGDFTVVASVTDSAGNEGTDTETGTIDTTAPTITLDTPALTNDNTPTVTGSSDLANTSLAVTFTDADGIGHTVTVTTDASGNWSAEAGQALADGNYTVSASISDAAGNNSSASDSGEVDTIPPELAFVPTFLLGQLVTLSGTSDLPAGSTVTVTQNLVGGGIVTYSATTAADGSWSLTGLSVPLANLSSITASASDAAGNVRTITSTDFDGTPPTLTANVDAIGNDNTPLISGTSDAGEGAQVTVVVTDANNNVSTLTAIVDDSGNWSVSPTTVLADGQFTVEASVRDGVGNLTEVEVTGVIDTIAPTLTLTGVGEGSDVTPVLSGRSNELGGTVSVTVTDSNGAVQTLTATVNSSGDWSIEVPTGLAEGAYTVVASISDAANNNTTVNATGSIDTTSPVVLVNDNGLGNDSTPLITGTSTEPAGTVVNISIIDSNSDTYTVTATVQAGGSWQVTAPSLPDGAYTVTATIVDAAGNVGTDSGLGSIDTLPASLAIDSLGTVNDDTPTISGTTNEPAGSVVNLSVSDGTNTYTFTASVQADGTWSADVPSSLNNGTVTIDASITDAAGNVTTANDTAVLDTTAPSITINVIGETNDTTPTINGTSDAVNGSVVTVVIDDGINLAETLTTTVSGGTWTVTASSALAEGDFTVTATVTENGIDGTATRTGIIDTTMPAIDINALDVTNDTTPTVSGTASAPQGSTVTVVFTDANNNSHTVTTVMQSNGTWSVAASTLLAEGEYTVTATVSDQAGNPATASASGEIDITAPVVIIDALGASSDVTPLISGQTTGAAVGSLVLLTITDSAGNVQSATALVQADGSWSVEPSTALAEGDYTVVATVSDAAGNGGNDTETGTIDVTAPTITIDAPALTNDNTPTVTGTSDMANTSIAVTFTDADGTSHTVTVTTDASGNWSAEAGQALADGNYTVSASISDAAGNSSSASDTGEVDTIAPDIRVIPSFLLGNLVGLSGTSDLPEGSVITITEHLVGGLIGATYTATTDANGDWTLANITVSLLNLAYVTATGTDAAGNIATVSTLDFDNVAPELTVSVAALTNDTTPTISGTTDMGQGTVINVTVQDANGDSQSFTATVQSDQTWSVDVPTELADGTFTVTASVRDQVGNLTTEQTTGVLDSVAPTLSINAIGGTTEARPTISGSSNEIGGLVVVEIAGQTLTTTVDTDGTWQLVVPVDIVDGSYTIEASITDDANNTQTATAPITVDTVAPVVAIDTLGIGNSSTPVISGSSTEAPGTQVSVTITDSNNDTQILTATVLGDGTWQVTPATLPDGNYTVTASITDVAGNIGSDTESGSIDTISPSLSVNSLGTTNNSTPTISGTSDEPAGSIVSVSVSNDGNSYSLSATVQVDGTWSVDVVTPLNDGSVTITASITDAANNTTTATDNATLDTNAPTVSIGTLAITNDTTPTISGTSNAVDGTQVTLNVEDALGNTQTVITTVTGGIWSVELGTVLSEGQYSVNASVTENGLTGTASKVGEIDLTAPSIQVNSPAITNDTTPTISGTSDAPQGTIVTLVVSDSLGNDITASAVVNASGNWSVAIPSSLAEGAYTIEASLSDTAGNTATASETGLIDITAPDVVIDTIAVATDLTPVASGSATGAAVGNRVVVTFVDAAGTSHSVETTLDSSLNWQVEATQALAEGQYTVTAVVTDSAGNDGSASTTSAVDTTAPVVSIDQNSLTLTNDSTPIVSGTSDAANSQVVVTFIATGGVQHTVTTTTGSNGDWQVAADQALAEGAYSVTVTVTDSAGNTGTDSKAGGEVDTIAPELSIVPSFLLGNLVSLSGTSDLPEGSVITITNHLIGGGVGVPYTTTVDANGDWSVLNLSLSLLNLAYVEASATDAAGNTTTISTQNFDNSAPELTVDIPATSADTTPLISGTSDVGSGETVSLIVEDANGTQQSFSTLINSDGSWSVEVPTELVNGTYTVQASVTDVEGRTTEVTESGVIDASFTITIDDGLQLTNDNTPFITGTSNAPNSLIEIVFDNGTTQQTKTVTSQSDGSWSVSPDTTLIDGLYSVTATVLSTGDSTGAVSGLKVDTIPPTLENIAVEYVLLGLAITGINGTTDAEDGAIVQLDNAQALGIELISSGGSVVQNGQWSIDIVQVNLLDLLGLGLDDARISITDAAGNVRIVDIDGNDLEVNGQSVSSGGVGPEDIISAADEIESALQEENSPQQLSESIDLSLVLVDTATELTANGESSPLNLTTADVLSNDEPNEVLTLNTQIGSLAYTSGNEPTPEPAKEVQNNAEELIKKLIEGGNNTIDI